MTEMQRILSLTRPTLSPAVLPDLGVRLRPAQVDALLEWTRALSSTTPYGPPGLAVLAGCGHGKTLIGLLLPYVAATLGKPVRTLYLVPAAIREQWLADASMWSAAGAYVWDPAVISHEGLSAPSGRSTLRDIAPDILVIDEAHHFTDPESGRWRRVVEYLAYRPETRVVVMSGSLSWRSLLQARHLLLAALRGWCPLPSDRSIFHWAACIDVKGEPCADDRRAVKPLVDAYPPTGQRTNGGEAELARNTRAAYRARLASCPGVVLTSTSGVDASLRSVAWRPKTPMPSAVVAAVAGLEERWELPDGTELVSALEYARHAATLGLGFYSRWDPATVDPEWVAARRAWSGVVRALVAYRGDTYQTPAAVVAAAERGELGGRDRAAYEAWCAVADREPPTTETVWVDEDYAWDLLWEYHDASEGRHTGGLLAWVRTPALGAALPWAYHGAGSSPPDGGLAVASYLVHGTGWSGAPAAGYSRALILEPPSSGATWEQLLARHHRSGQVDDVEVHVLCNTSHGFAAIGAGIADAEYVEQTTGQAQRLLLADWVGYRAPRTTKERA